MQVGKLLKSGITLIVVVLSLSMAGFTVVAQGSDSCSDFDNAEDFIARGDNYYNLVEYAAAAADYSCALALEESAEIYYWRGWSYSAIGEYEAAEADFTTALGLEPDNPADILNGRGIVYLDLYEYDLAEADFTAAIASDAANAAAFNNRGNVYYVQGDYTRAVEQYDLAIDLPDSNKYIPYYNRGIAYYELGDYDQSLSDLDQSLVLNPNYDSAMLARGWTNKVINPSEANNDFLRYVEIIEAETLSQAIAGSTDETGLTLAAGRVYRLQFDGTAGQTANIAARADVDATTYIDPLLVLLDPAGVPIASDDDSGVNLDAVIVGFELPATGSYTLLLTHAFGGSEGDIRLNLTLDGEQSRIFSIFTLLVGNLARVYTTEGDRLNVRSGPGLNFEIVGRLERESTVTLLEGPRKADGLAWWRIRSADGVEGWSVERVDEEQTLQPPLVIGAQATIYPLSGDRLNVRQDAGRSFDIVTQLEPGVEVTIVDGPQVADGYRWWKIRLADGVEGWAVDEAEGEQTIFGKAQ